MDKFAVEKVGKYYINKKTGEVFKFIARCNAPFIELENVATKSVTGAGLGGLLLNAFVELVPVEPEKGSENV